MLDVDAWMWSQPRLTGTPPPPLSCHTSNVHAGQQIYVFGGMTISAGVHMRARGGYAEGQVSCPSPLSHTRPPGNAEKDRTSVEYQRDTWTLDGETMVWKRLRRRGTVPEGVAYHSTELLPSGHLVTLGGWRGETADLGALCALDLAAGTWRLAAVPGDAPSGMYGMRTVTVGDKIVAFGGWDTINPLAVVHVLDTGVCAKALALREWHVFPGHALMRPRPRAGFMTSDGPEVGGETGASSSTVPVPQPAPVGA